MKKIFVNGTFDIIHPGHISLLNYAKDLGDELYVAIDSDSRVREKKGQSRPINTFNDRKFLLENLKSVDYVLQFSTDQELEEIIKSIDPYIMMVGSDWKGKPVIGSQYAQNLLYFSRIGDYASSKIIQNIIDRR
jgi:D-beta-D-heptose 7-phosphate kinase/D-beta-D-heptose 1-phosphate adenosyltransferase